MPLPPKVKAGCGAVTLFFAGVLCGVVGVIVLLSIIIPRSERWKNDESRQFLADHFSNRIKLTEDQKEKLRPGFHEILDRRWKLRADYIKSDHELLEEYFESIKSELTPDQQKKARQVLDDWWKQKQRMLAK